jgi:UDPglucose 6-dehydrogenase
MKIGRIAIIGHGFVGQAVDYAFHYSDNIIIDPKYGEVDYSQFEAPEAVFICVPTPMSDDGEVNSEHIESSLENIRTHWSEIDGSPTVIIKSTVTPQVLSILSGLYHDLNLCYNPEFLTERAAKDDFVNPPFHIIGTDRTEIAQHVINLYGTYSLCNNCLTYQMTMEEAAWVKYGINSFLATKIIFFNQLAAEISKNGFRPNAVLNAISADERIGPSHTRVPGFDGKPGYGGACFPKDVSAIRATGDFSLLDEVHRINVNYRKDLDLDARELEQNVRFK